jgi:mannose-1-phosphate guanylyltransferase/phosphomannomutase
MAGVTEDNAVFGGNETGAYIFGSFSPAFDALSAFCRLLEFLSTGDRDLGALCASLPRPHVVHRAVRTPWEQKGAVMRHVTQAADGDRTVDTEGLKVFHGDDWALVVPDPEDPITHVWAEGASRHDSEAWADRYAGLVEQALE